LGREAKKERQRTVRPDDSTVREERLLLVTYVAYTLSDDTIVRTDDRISDTVRGESRIDKPKSILSDASDAKTVQSYLYCRSLRPAPPASPSAHGPGDSRLRDVPARACRSRSPRSSPTSRSWSWPALSGRRSAGGGNAGSSGRGPSGLRLFLGKVRAR
jgi:hypothetical protein